MLLLINLLKKEYLGENIFDYKKGERNKRDSINSKLRKSFGLFNQPIIFPK
jgi:hypothetical protein